MTNKGHEALPLPSGMLKAMKAQAAAGIAKLARKIIEPLEAKLAQRTQERDHARARILAFQSSWMPIPSDTSRLSERDVKWRGEFDKATARIRELQTEHMHKPPQERVACTGCSLPIEVKELQAARDALNVEVEKMRAGQKELEKYRKTAMGWQVKYDQRTEMYRKRTVTAETRADEAEAAVQLLADHYFTSVDRNGLLELCQACNKHPGCSAEENEPCPAFIKAAERFDKFAPVRKVLDRIKG